jgi:hypothetical protein
MFLSSEKVHLLGGLASGFFIAGIKPALSQAVK